MLNVTPERVIAALHEAGINGVLMGTHGINVYRDEARATQDVDVLVTKKDARKAVRVLERTFPYLEVVENAAVARFVDPVTQKVVIDVMKPASQAMHAVFRHTIAIGTTHRIPSLEMALISKFAAMISPNRPAKKKAVDAGDFLNMAEGHLQKIDLSKLRRLADQICFGGADKIMQFINDAKAGRVPKL